MDPQPKKDMVGKALQLLTLLGEYPEGATTTGLSKASGLPFSTTYRLLGTLCREGFALSLIHI